MKSRKKISRIGLLMIVSELLITAFVFRWLQSEFNGEKDQLQKNLFSQFMDARSRVMDSVISKKYIEPILHSPSGFKIRTVDVKGDLPPEAGAKSHMEIYSQDTSMIIDSIQDAPHPHGANIEIKVESDTSKDVLYRGVKMFITRVKDENGDSGVFEKHVLPGDTAMLKKFFTENLQKENLGVKTVWVCKNSVGNSPPPPFYYESDFMENPYGVVVSKYNGFLFEKILPQILFALLLLAITSAAFLFSFRSLRNQLRLAAIKDDFISNMSHELKTPVATMRVAIEAMQHM
ncbi:MAG: histidine kinase dimerization/phospho-acceptor domain-containing protein, partial [Chitinophagales bacterium]